MNKNPLPQEQPRDVPVPSSGREAAWASDAIAGLLRAFDLPYVCLNPGASYRGLHDSLVNYLGNTNPRMLLCLHEEHAVAAAHGYAKVTGKPLGVIVHSNVGLMHASMAIFNAWCDRVPVLLMGATGPVDAAKRRPWIDWIHTAKDQGALVRHFTKWDDQPASAPAALESLLRAKQIAETAPKGPVYVCFDAALQESRLDDALSLPDVDRYRPPPTAHPDPELISRAAALLSQAKSPLILVGRVGRSLDGWNDRVALAEALDADVLTNLKLGAAFPTLHPLHTAPAGIFLSAEAIGKLRAADVILSLDWLDLAGTLKQAWGTEPVSAKVIQASVDQYVHNGWSMDYQGLPPMDLYLLSEPDAVVRALRREISPRKGAARPEASTVAPSSAKDEAAIRIPTLAGALRRAVKDEEVTLIRVPIGWSGDLWEFRHPLDYVGYDGGGGIGSGPGMSVGAALALRGTGRLPVSILGDGDFLMGMNALWTAAHERIPLLVIVANNRSFFNDELHQERVAKERGRPVENRWIGQRIDDPAPDLAVLARGQGLEGIGPVESPDALPAALAEAVQRVKEGRPCVVDVRVSPGYAPATAAGMLRSSGS